MTPSYLIRTKLDITSQCSLRHFLSEFCFTVFSHPVTKGPGTYRSPSGATEIGFLNHPSNLPGAQYYT